MNNSKFEKKLFIFNRLCLLISGKIPRPTRPKIFVRASHETYLPRSCLDLAKKNAATAATVRPSVKVILACPGARTEPAALLVPT